MSDKNPKLTKLFTVSLSYLDTKMILVKVNKLSSIIINHYKFLLLKIFIVLHDETNKSWCCQFSAKTCNKCMLRETSCEDCQPVNEVFYGNRCVICHFKLSLYDIREAIRKNRKWRKSGKKKNLNTNTITTKYILFEIIFCIHYIKKIIDIA